MKLDLNIYNIQDIRFADKTYIKGDVLNINRDELKMLLEEDSRLANINIELAHPGEKCRILHVEDVIEPRSKADKGNKLSDIQSGLLNTGEGKTSVLRKTAVVLSDYRELGEVTTSRDPNGEIIDMAGPGAEISPYGKTHNIIILPEVKKGVSNHDYLAALKIAGLKTSSYLADAAAGLDPDEVESYDLPSLTEIAGDLKGLPRVTYIFQILSLQFEPITGEPVLYGRQADGIVPTILHPNEILDGAVTSPLPALNLQTYQIQNHPIIKELYNRHGKDLCFTGVIITTAPNNVPEYERVADIAAGLAKRVIGADGAILTKSGGGAPELVMARTAQKCEQLGIKTTIAMLHMGADISDAKYGASTIFNMPEVDAIVSMGIPFMELKLPPVDRIIGRPGSSESPVSGEIVRAIRWIKGSQCQIGGSRLKAVRY
ncbi:glycine/sarcosine/betaine reductase component B subunit [Thermodesulfobacteriota bacterium]